LLIISFADAAIDALIVDAATPFHIRRCRLRFSRFLLDSLIFFAFRRHFSLIYIIDALKILFDL